MLVNLETVLLQAQPGGAGMSVFLMIGMFVVMYFFLIRPQAKRQKEQKKFSDSISAGEEIITNSGIHGRINRINEDGTLQLEIARATFIKMERSAVSMELTVAYRKKAATAATATATSTDTPIPAKN
jgi:preprotein translocase subunit YajC